MTREPSSVGNFEGLSIADANENEEPEQSSVSNDLPANMETNENFFLELQETINISRSAYKEIMTMAFEAKTWVVDTPALGSLGEFLQMFRSPPPPGMRVECSIESAVVPISPERLISMMMVADRWALSLSHIVSRGSSHVPAEILEELLNSACTLKSMLLLNAVFQLPTPLVQTRKFCFLRCLRQIMPKIWAIVDLSCDYFPGAFGDVNVFGSEKMCRRRPSGLIVRRHDEYSQVIWIENVEVPEGPSKDDIYYGMTSSNLAFSAKCWVDTLMWRLKRNDSRFFNVRMEVNQKAGTHLLKLTDNMREVYKEIVSETPDEGKWVTLSNKDVRIFSVVSEIPDHDGSLGLNDYIAVTSFRLQAKPISVIDFLVKKNMDIQWPRLPDAEEPEEVIRFASEDDSNRITLHKKVVTRNETEQDFEYHLQEASSDGFCSLIISTPLSQLDVHIAFLIGSSVVVSLQPSGFTVMPDGPDGLHSNASFVTIAIQRQLNILETDQAIATMCDLINAIIKEITEELSDEANTPS